MSPALGIRRAIVDKFMVGYSMRGCAKLFGVPYYVVENVIRWSNKSETERKRVWRKLTKAGTMREPSRRGGEGKL